MDCPFFRTVTWTESRKNSVLESSIGYGLFFAVANESTYIKNPLLHPAWIFYQGLLNAADLTRFLVYNSSFLIHKIYLALNYNPHK